jgi:hypothetical protein
MFDQFVGVSEVLSENCMWDFGISSMRSSHLRTILRTILQTTQLVDQRGFPETAKGIVVILTLDEEEAADYIYEVVENAADLTGIAMRDEIGNHVEMYSDISLAIRLEMGVGRALLRVKPYVELQTRKSG